MRTLQQRSPRVKDDERGATMLEFAITSFLFLMLIIVTLESAVAGFRALTTQFVASEAVRRGIIGDLDPASLRAFTINLADGYGIKLDPADVQICTIYELKPDRTCKFDTTGSQFQFLNVRVETETPYFLGLWSIELIGQALSRNEKRP